MEECDWRWSMYKHSVLVTVPDDPQLLCRAIVQKVIKKIKKYKKINTIKGKREKIEDRNVY